VSAVPILVVGDVMTDVITQVDRPFAVGSDTQAKVRTAGGGSGANTACWLAFAGARVTFCGRVGTDPFGTDAVSALRSAGVVSAVSVDGMAPTGTCVVLVGPDGERSMLPDAGANSMLTEDDLPRLAFVEGAHLHLSGYTLLNPGSRKAGRAAIDRARKAGMTVSVDASSAAPLEAVGPKAFLSWVRPVDLLLCNADEAFVLVDSPDVPRAAALLIRHVPEAVVKTGADGAWWAGRRADPAFAGAQPAKVVDTTGAGDAFAAGFLPAWLAGAGPGAALAAGHRLGAAAVAQIGARPARVDPSGRECECSGHE
jgi:sugar/nucleoside kinase (ribokinase family)